MILPVAGAAARAICVHSGLASPGSPLNRGVFDDISAGLATGRFTIATTEAALLFAMGASQAAIARTSADLQPAAAVSLAQQVCTLILRGLGVPTGEADAIVRGGGKGRA